jgi:hypothetical protein
MRDRLESVRQIPAGGIYAANMDGLMVLMDLRTEEYFALDPSSTTYWEALERRSGEIAAARSDVVGAVEAERAAARGAAFDAFVRECTRRGFLVESDEPASEASFPMTTIADGALRALPARLAAWVCMVATWRSLRISGFAQTYRRYCRIEGATPEGLQAALPPALAGFLHAENFFWYRGAPRDCLPRSLALFRYLRTRGFPAVHKIGGRRVPSFFMHAWVEVFAAPVLDQSPIVDEYVILARSP